MVQSWCVTPSCLPDNVLVWLWGCFTRVVPLKANADCITSDFVPILYLSFSVLRFSSCHVATIFPGVSAGHDAGRLQMSETNFHPYSFLIFTWYTLMLLSSETEQNPSHCSQIILLLCLCLHLSPLMNQVIELLQLHFQQPGHPS